MCYKLSRGHDKVFTSMELFFPFPFTNGFMRSGKKLEKNMFIIDTPRNEMKFEGKMSRKAKTEPIRKHNLFSVSGL